MKLRHACLLGLALLGSSLSLPAKAMYKLDPGLTLERVTNSPVISVKIQNEKARLIELRIAGKSVASRTLSGSSEMQVVQLHVDLSELDEGTTPYEVRVYDANGDLISSDSSAITIDSPMDVPVEILHPKQGSTLQNLVEIKVDLKQRFDKPFVSFMINGEWKAIRNTQPFTYVWDTETVPNGWHEIQVWVVTSDNTTIRSRKHRVFVNNPGGRTFRNMPNTAAPVAAPPALPKLSLLTSVPVVGQVAKPSLPAIPKIAPKATPTGARTLTPTGTRMAVAPKSTPKPVVKAPVTKVNTVKPVAKPQLPKVAPAVSQTVVLSKGTQLPALAQLTLVLGQTVIQFPDVQPYVQKGIAMSPIRHLFQGAGAKVKWDNQNKVVTTQGLEKNIRVAVGQNSAMVGKEQVMMEHAAFLLSSRTIIPLSFAQEALGLKIQVDTKTGHVLIEKQTK